MNRLFSGSFILLLAIVLSFCAKGDEGSPSHSFRIYDENGVTIAETMGGPKYSEPIFTVEKILEIRPVASERDAQLVRPRGFTRDASGLYYVVDEASLRIVVFNQEGQYVRTIGRRGNGPGEFNRLIFQRIHDNALEVFDDILLRTTRYDIEGNLIEVVSLPQPLRRMKALYRANQSKLIAVQFFHEDEEGYAWYQRKCTVLSEGGEVEASLETSRIKGEKIAVFRRSSGGVPLYTRMDIFFRGEPVIICPSSSEIILSDGEEPELVWYDLSGQTLKKVILDIPGQPVLRNEERQIMRSTKGMTGPPGQRVEWSELVEIKNPKAFWRNVDIDNYGYIWLEIPLRGIDVDETSFRLLSPEGEYIGDANLPYHSGITRFGEYLAIMIDNDTGERIPTVYRITSAVEGLKYP